MAMTPSTMLPLGTLAPNFRLLDTEKQWVSRDDFRGKRALLVMFICNHCHFVKHVAGELAQLGRDYLPKGVGIVAINANDAVAYPDDAPPRMREEKQQRGYEFPYLFDEAQTVAVAFQAACTPDFYLFDEDLKLSYRGRFDDARPKNSNPITGKDLRKACENLFKGKEQETNQFPSMGCGIKWKAGNEPAGFFI